MSKSLVEEQFGKTAEFYRTHKPHAQGKSLERMVELARPQKSWTMLDVATGGGHVAYAFAPHVARVWSTDITAEMLAIVRDEVAKRGLANVRVAYAKAEGLPFEDQSFDLVTCRIAPHHFDSIPDFLVETHRVLKPNGIFALVDNVVEPGPVGDYVNGFERFRDPSHLRAWTLAEWRTALAAKGFVVEHEETIPKAMLFNAWASRHDATIRAAIRALIANGNAAVQASVKAAEKDGDLAFELNEGLFICKRV
jgi:ubiquinone/menaquinone biosynthesis C-methylase UbiE